MHAASPFCRGPGRGIFAGCFHITKKIKKSAKKSVDRRGRKCYYIQALAERRAGQDLENDTEKRRKNDS